MMEKNCIVNINGKITPPENATISIFDRGFLFGDSIYEATLSHQGIPLFLEEHIDRLKNSASLIGMNLDFTYLQIKKAILLTTEAAHFERGLVRWIVTRGIDKLNIFPGENLKQNLIIIYKELPEYPERWYSEGLLMTFAEIKRNHPSSTNPEAKTGNYINNVMAAKEAQKLGADDALMLNIYGEVTEGTTNNIWIVKDGVFLTPSTQSGILKGITRTKLIELCQSNKLPIRETKLSKDDLYNCDEAFITSSTKNIVPIHQIDQRPITKGFGKYTKILSDLYLKETKKYFKNFS